MPTRNATGLTGRLARGGVALRRRHDAALSELLGLSTEGPANVARVVRST